MPKIVIVACEPVARPRRAILEDAVEHLIDLLDHEDDATADMEPDPDNEESDGGEDQSWPEWRPKLTYVVGPDLAGNSGTPD